MESARRDDVQKIFLKKRHSCEPNKGEKRTMWLQFAKAAEIE
jgi:hypothetical protein